MNGWFFIIKISLCGRKLTQDFAMAPLVPFSLSSLWGCDTRVCQQRRSRVKNFLSSGAAVCAVGVSLLCSAAAAATWHQLLGCTVCFLSWIFSPRRHRSKWDLKRRGIPAETRPTRARLFTLSASIRTHLRHSVPKYLKYMRCFFYIFK
jgi:hypothetical protein